MTVSQMQLTKQWRDSSGLIMCRGRAQAPSSFRADIEGLRAVAVILVIAYHAGLLNVTGGFVGVDVFFVLSGYLITGILVRQAESPNGVEVTRFYSRRILRLLPAAIFVLFVVLIFERIVYSPMELIDLAKSAIATALYSSNVFFMVHSLDYFSIGASNNPLLHTWSLAVEEQFYLVWPLLIIVGYRVARSRKRMAVLLAVFSLLSCLGSIWLTQKRQPWAFYAMPARAWEFGLGGIASLLPDLSSKRQVLARWLGWTGLGLIVGTAFFLSPSARFPGTVALLPTLGTAASILSGTNVHAWGVARLLKLEFMQWIGKRSYSLYLWHWPVLVAAQTLAPGLTWRGRLVCVAIATLVAAVTRALIENPIRFHRSLVARPKLVVKTGIAATLSAAAMAGAEYQTAITHGGVFARAAQEQTAIDASNCTTDFLESRPKFCTFGKRTSDVEVVLFGDSHATQWFPALQAISERHGWRLISMVKYSCPAARVTVYNRVLQRTYFECDAWRAAALREILRLKPTAVIIGQYSWPDTGPASGDSSFSAFPYGRWRDGMHQTLATLDSAGIRTYIFADSPAHHFRVPICLSRAQRDYRPYDACSVRRVDALNSSRQAEHAAAVGLSSASFVDLSDEICGPIWCEPIREGQVVYRDQNHLTVRFVTQLTPLIERRLVPLPVPRSDSSSR